MDIFLIEIGLMVSSFGIALFYATDLGSPAMATLCDGLHRVFSIPYGNANMIANIVLLLILLLLDRKYINIGTILCVFTIGPWMNLFTPMLGVLGLKLQTMPVRLLLSACGTLFMSFGLGLYMAVDRGYGALEGIVQYMRTHTRLNIGFAKIAQDALLVLAGVLMGATWGAGTLIAIVATGPILQWACRFFEKKLVLPLRTRF